MTLVLDIPPHIEAHLATDAAREGLPVPQYVLRMLERSAEAQPAPARHSALALAERVRASVPADEWAKLPADLAANLDHYLYGHPRESE